MTIRAIEKLEDCFDGSRVYRYFFDAAWSRASILRLGALGALDYFSDFPRPLFRLRTHDGLQVTGVEADPDCRVVLPRARQQEVRALFESLFSHPPT